MKKLLVLLLSLVLALALASCSSSNQKEEAPAEEGSATEETSAEVTDDGQNPVMNFIGTYAKERASILVEAGEGSTAKFTVYWGSSAWEHTEWVMSGELNTDTLVVEYSDCVRTDYVYNDEGEVESETVVYENGTGRITFTDEGPLALTWEDDQDRAADDMVFEYAN